MTNPYYTESFAGQAGQTARAEQVSSELQSIQTGFDLVFDTVQRNVRVPGTDPALNALPAAAERANRYLRFGPTGQPEMVLGPFQWRGDWASATAYVRGDIVRSGIYGSLYICITAHTSSGTINLANFEVVIDLTGLNIIRNEIRTSSFTAVPGGDYMIDTSGGSVVVTLPASPSILDAPINLTHIGGTLGSGQTLTVARNGQRIMSLLEDLTFDKVNASISLMFADSTRGWRLRVLA